MENNILDSCFHLQYETVAFDRFVYQHWKQNVALNFVIFIENKASCQTLPTQPFLQHDTCFSRSKSTAVDDCGVTSTNIFHLTTDYCEQSRQASSKNIYRGRSDLSLQ